MVITTVLMLCVNITPLVTNRENAMKRQIHQDGLKIEETRLAHSDAFSSIQESANPIITKT